MRRLLIAAFTLVLLLAPMPAAAAEESDVMVRVTGIHLIARGTVVNVDTEYSCTWLTYPEPPDDAYFEETWVVVTIQQAVGSRQQAWGESLAYFEGDPTCDGIWHPLRVQVVPDPGGPAFKTGVAAMHVFMKASYSWCRVVEGPDNPGCPPGWDQVAFFDRWAEIAWHQVKLAK